MPLRKIVSFGFRHSLGMVPSHGVRVIDVRKKFNNPYHNKALRNKRGTDFEVQMDIRLTPNFDYQYSLVRDEVVKCGADTVYIGCTGGHHRSVYIAELLGRELGVPVEHRDIDKP